MIYTVYLILNDRNLFWSENRFGELRTGNLVILFISPAHYAIAPRRRYNFPNIYLFIDKYTRGIDFTPQLCSENLGHLYGTLPNHPEELGRLDHLIGMPVPGPGVQGC